MANLIIKNITKVDFLFGTFEDDFFVDYWLEITFFCCLVDQPFLDQW